MQRAVSSGGQCGCHDWVTSTIPGDAKTAVTSSRNNGTTALQLLRAAAAARLLGCDTILVGVQPEIAQTLVGLGVDLRGITTRSTLAEGLQAALRKVGFLLVRGNSDHRN